MALREDHEEFDLPSDESDPAEMDAMFREEWKKMVVRNALSRMREASGGTDQASHVELFARYQVEYERGERPTRPDLAEACGLTVNQVNYALKCQEKEFVSALKNELRDQVTTEADFRAEARELFGI